MYWLIVCSHEQSVQKQQKTGRYCDIPGNKIPSSIKMLLVLIGGGGVM